MLGKTSDLTPVILSQSSANVSGGFDIVQAGSETLAIASTVSILFSANDFLKANRLILSLNSVDGTGSV
jgi:hypothetical protein